MHSEELVKPIGAEFPFQIGVLADYSGAAAGDVEEHPVAALLEALSELGLVHLDLVILNPCSFEALSSLQQHRFPDVVDVDLTSIVHERCEGQRLTSRAATVVENRLLRLHVDAHRQELAGLVLDLEMATLEFDKREETLSRRCIEADAVRSMPASLKLEAIFLPESCD